MKYGAQIPRPVWIRAANFGHVANYLHPPSSADVFYNIIDNMKKMKIYFERWSHPVIKYDFRILLYILKMCI